MALLRSSSQMFISNEFLYLYLFFVREMFFFFLYKNIIFQAIYYMSTNITIRLKRKKAKNLKSISGMYKILKKKKCSQQMMRSDAEREELL